MYEGVGRSRTEHTSPWLNLSDVLMKCSCELETTSAAGNRQGRSKNHRPVSGSYWSSANLRCVCGPVVTWSETLVDGVRRERVERR